MKITVGIVLFKNEFSEIAKNVKELNKSLLYAQSKRTNFDFDIVALNNHRLTDYEGISELGISYSESVDNLGFGRAHNQIMSKAFSEGTDNYIMINPDGFPELNCVHEMLLMSETERCGLVEAMQFPMEHPKPWDRVTYQTPWCSGACTLITSDAYQSSGGFDENFWLYCEDVDLSWRLSYSGFNLRFAPRAQFIHDTETRSNPVVRRSMLLAARYLAKKWKAPDFQRHAEECLVNEKYYPEAIYLPPIEEPPQYFDAAYPAEFRQLFSFAIPRWNL